LVIDKELGTLGLMLWEEHYIVFYYDDHNLGYNQRVLA